MMKFFHISAKHLGEKPILSPKLPESSVPSIEGDIPRICVSTSIFFCLRSILGCAPITTLDVISEFKRTEKIVPFESRQETIARGDLKIVFPSVYSTFEFPYLPPKASDYRLNDERWFLEPTEFLFEGYIDLKWLVEKGQIRLTSQAGTLPPSYLEIGKIEIKKQKHIC